MCIAGLVNLSVIAAFDVMQDLEIECDSVKDCCRFVSHGYTVLSSPAVTKR